MKYLIFLLIFITQFAHAKDENANHALLTPYKETLKHIKTFGDWGVYHKFTGDKKTCHAISSPYRTKAFDGIREALYFVVSYKGYEQFTCSINSGFGLEESFSVIVNIGNRSFALNHIKNKSTITSSSEMDISLINNILRAKSNFSVRSYNKLGDTALDFYSIKGLNKAIYYMEKNCEQAY